VTPSHRDWLGEAARFGVVGVTQNGLNIACFWVATELGAHYRPAAVLAGVLAFLFGFSLNRIWTFEGQTMPVGHQGMRYLCAFAGALGVGLLVLTALVELAGVEPVPAQVIAVFLVAPASFLVQRTWVFRRQARRANTVT
jgi:putative flippase GtrA